MWEDGAEKTTWVEDTIKETVFTLASSKSKARGKARASDIVTSEDRPGITQESASAHQRAKARGKDFKENVTNAVRRVIPQERGRKAKTEESQKEKETVTKKRQRIVELGKGSLAGRWRMTARRLEVETTGGRRSQPEVSSRSERRE